MRAFLVAAVVAGSAASFVFACSTFEASDAPAVDAGPDASPDALSDAGNPPEDAATMCTREPEWAYPGGVAPTTATCAGVTGVNLLSSTAHCGRCDHSCGPETCVEGLCVARREDPITSSLYRVENGTAFYVRHPPGLGHEVARFDPGTGPKVLGRLDIDAGDDNEIRGLDVTVDAVYLRTETALRRAKKDEASNDVPALVAPLTYQLIASVTAGSGVVYVSAIDRSRFDAVTVQGSSTPFLESSAYPHEAKLAGSRFVWLTQPFVLLNDALDNVLHVHDGTTNRDLLTSPDRLGGLVIDGNEAILMRASSTAGAILAVDLTSGSARALFEGALDNANYQLTVAVDATYVYWLRSLDKVGSSTEIWKRARCGGAAVRIAKHAYVYGLALSSDRVWFGSEDGLWSFAK